MDLQLGSQSSTGDRGTRQSYISVSDSIYKFIQSIQFVCSNRTSAGQNTIQNVTPINKAIINHIITIRLAIPFEETLDYWKAIID